MKKSIIIIFSLLLIASSCKKSEDPKPVFTHANVTLSVQIDDRDLGTPYPITIYGSDEMQVLDEKFQPLKMIDKKTFSVNATSSTIVNVRIKKGATVSFYSEPLFYGLRVKVSQYGIEERNAFYQDSSFYLDYLVK